jgi:hypothetical protein
LAAVQAGRVPCSEELLRPPLSVGNRRLRAVFKEEGILSAPLIGRRSP